MREIKFRGKCHLIETDERIWIYGCNDWGEIVDENDENWRVDESTIGQFTGLKDENGTEIYEGDVLHISIENRVISNYPQKDLTKTGVVKYSEENARFAIFTEGKTGDSFIICKDYELEVIGNIFDNPELKERFWTVWNRENLN